MIAQQQGFTNYKNYSKTLKANQEQKKADLKFCLENIASEKEVTKKTDLALSFIQDYKPSFQNLLEILKQFQRSQESIQAVCEKLNLMKDKLKTFLFDDFCTADGQYEINFRAPYFIAKDISLSNLNL